MTLEKHTEFLSLKQDTTLIYKIDMPDGVTINFNQFDERNLESSYKEYGVSNFITKLQHLRCALLFQRIESEIFQSNLQLIDTDLPVILSYMLLYQYKYKINTIMDLLNKLNENNPMKYNLSLGHPFYIYKLKAFLIESFLGLNSEALWFGTLTADQDVLWKTIFSFENTLFPSIEVIEYLFLHTRLESYNNLGPNTTNRGANSYKYGLLYQEDDNYYIKLNLQIRFN